MISDRDREQLRFAYRILDEGETQLAVYAMRDTEVVERLGMKDLFWSLYNHGTCVLEVRRFLDEILEEARP